MTFVQLTKTFIYASVAWGVMVNAPAAAEEMAASIDRFGACMQDARSDTGALQACVRAEHKRQDAALNHFWQDRVLGLKEPLLGTVRTAQLKWIAYRDATCDAERVTFSKPTDASIAQGYCLIRQTATQIAWLNRVVEGPRLGR